MYHKLSEQLISYCPVSLMHASPGQGKKHSCMFENPHFDVALLHILPCSCTFTVSPVPHPVEKLAIALRYMRKGIGRADPKDLGLHGNFVTWFTLGKVFSALLMVDAAPRSCRTRWRHEEHRGPRVQIHGYGQGYKTSGAPIMPYLFEKTYLNLSGSTTAIDRFFFGHSH